MSFPQGQYEKNDPVYFGNQEYSTPKDYFKCLVQIIRRDFGDRPIRMIDVGCATGGFLYYDLRHLTVTEAVGIDISQLHLEQAKAAVPSAEFQVDSLVEPKMFCGRTFDVVTCLGTLSLFDDLLTPMRHLMEKVASGGSLYIFDLLNPEPVDVLMRYRTTGESAGPWRPAFNVRCRQTWMEAAHEADINCRVEFTDFRISIDIPKTDNPMRAWTELRDGHGRQIMVGRDSY